MKKILFVCTGNICRSPIAEGIFSKLVSEAGLEEAFVIDSAGTAAWCTGNAPDPVAQAVANQAGIDIGYIRARKLTRMDLDYFDLVLVADEENFHEVSRISTKANQQKIQYLMNYSVTESKTVIPDPYGEGIHGFKLVFRMIKDACTGLLQALKQDMSSVHDR